VTHSADKTELASVGCKNTGVVIGLLHVNPRAILGTRRNTHDRPCLNHCNALQPNNLYAVVTVC